MRTAQERRGAIDVARGCSLLLVVAGHLAMAVVDRDSTGALRGDNVLALHPGLAFLGLLAPMPVFFAAAGWSHSGPDAHDRVTTKRIAPIVLVATVVCTVWGSASIVSILVTGGANTVSRGARIASQPMWFLAAYVPFVALPRQLGSLARAIRFTVPAAICFVALGDWLLHAHDLPRAVGFPGFFVVWQTPWVLGAWWRSRAADPTFDERRTGLLLALTGLVACAALVRWAGYAPSLIDAVPGRRTNSTPPGLFTLSASVVQVGLLMMVAQPLDNVAARRSVLVASLSRAAVGIYAWHLTAFALCAATIALGLPGPERFGAAWWWTRPLWFGAIIAVTLLLALATQSVIGRINTTVDGQTNPTVWFAVVATTIAAGLTGLYGPRSIPMSVSIIALFGVSIGLLSASGD